MFDIVGPVMIGPSSSHTAGAVRLGRMALEVLNAPPVEAEIYLHGSFAKTGKGHGTDLALVAGILGMRIDDENIVHAREIAAQKGIKISVSTIDLGIAHPNSAKIVVRDKTGRERTIIGSSIGGGNILVKQINNFPVKLTGEYYTLCAIYKDRLGMIAKVSQLMADNKINIAQMKVSREGKGGRVLMVVETDMPIPPEVATAICNLEGIEQAFILKPVKD